MHDSPYKHTRRPPKKLRGKPEDAPGEPVSAPVVLLSRDPEFADHLRDILFQDGELKDRIAVLSSVSAGHFINAGPKVIVVDDELVMDVLDLIRQYKQSFPVVVLFSEFTVRKVWGLFDRKYFNFKGFFRKEALRDSLVEQGKLASILRWEFNLTREESEAVQPLGSMIEFASEEPSELSTITSLFIDVKMRRFLRELQRVLERVEVSGLTKIGRRFRQQRHNQGLQALFSEMGRIGQELRSGDVRESLSDTNKKLLGIITERPPDLEAKSSIHILVRGETGTGKTLIARWIAKYLGMDWGFPHINVSALPAALLETELFGSLRGAFTDAVDRPGALVREYGGLVFLDEIGDLGLDTQGKLLTYLDNYSFRPLGWPLNEPVHAPCYIVAATNKPLENMIVSGAFRKDLFDRFIYRVEVPPLRERKEDLRLLVDFVLQDSRINPAGKVRGISFQALKVLGDYPFRGNFRELENILSRASALATEDLKGSILEKHARNALMETTGYIT